MIYLLLVSCLWAFSFGLIRVSFGTVDPILLACMRLVLSALIFVPFLQVRGVSWKHRGQLLMIGSVQYGAMYVLLFSAFQFVGPRSYLIALFTLTTPILVLICASAMERRPGWHGWAAGTLAVIGAAVIQWRTDLGSGFWKSFLLLQGSNAAFAFGQIAYRRVQLQITTALPEVSDRHIFGWMFLGGVIFTGLASTVRSDWGALAQLDGKQWATLVYLGMIASGLGFFWWNRGATLVTPPTLAVLNNLKVPLAVIVSLLVFQEWRAVAWPQFVAGSAVLGTAFWLSQRSTSDK